MKRWISLLLSLMLALGACVPTFAEELDIPTSWDVTSLYASVEDWETDYAKAESMVAEYDKFRGTLNSAENILAYYTWRYECELTRLAGRLETYAKLASALNTEDAKAKELDERFDELEDKIELAQDALWEEMQALPLETREELLSDPVLEGLSYYLRGLLEEPNPYDTEEARAAAECFEEALGRSEGTQSALLKAIPVPVVTLPDGTEVELTGEKYDEITDSDEYSHEFKMECLDATYQRLEPYLEIIAELLDTALLGEAAEAKLSGHATVLEEAMCDWGAEPELFDIVLEAAHEAQPLIQRYYAAYREALGLEQMARFDLSTTPTSYQRAEMTFEEALPQVRAALSVMGEEYMAKLEGLFAAGNVDVYPGENKLKGFRTSYDARDLGPYVMMNYTPSYGLDTVGAGLATNVHLAYSMENAGNVAWEPSHLILRVSDSLARLLVRRYRLDNAATDEERIYHLRQMINLFRIDIFENMRCIEFVDEALQVVEGGGELDADMLTALNLKLLEGYRGEAVSLAPGEKYSWANWSAPYDGYDDFEFVVGTLYAAAICQSILSGEEGAVDRYIAMMSAAATVSPVELLTIAGADPRDPQTYESAFAFIEGLIEEFEEATK